jgi:capsular polysaccharide biosynthesis protein
VATTPAPTKGFDPEAEQEVDFAGYGRMLARRWWLVAIGLVAGAVIGFLVSVGGTKLYSATATLYLGQPLNPSATGPINTLQTNSAAVGAIANAQSIDDKVAKECKTTTESFRKGISVQRVASAAAAKGLAAQVNPLVALTVQDAKKKVAVCVANGLAREAVAALGSYPAAKIKNLHGRILTDTEAIKEINAKLTDPNVSDAIQSFLQAKLQPFQQDILASSQLLLLAKMVESPKVTIHAAGRQVSAQSPRNTVLIAALIGLILGVIAALLWDRLVPRMSTRNGS